jgi:hypothetical protein
VRRVLISRHSRLFGSQHLPRSTPPPVSYLLNLTAASEVGIDAEQVRGVLVAIAAIVGTAQVASATGKIIEALDVAIDVADLAAQTEE